MSDVALTQDAPKPALVKMLVDAAPAEAARAAAAAAADEGDGLTMDVEEVHRGKKLQTSEEEPSQEPEQEQLPPLPQLSSRELQQLQAARQYFDHFDEGGKGFLDVEDIAVSMEYLGFECPFGCK